jgi:hypothetical protein
VKSSSTPIQLRAIRLVHTVVWVFFVVIILAIPVAAWLRRFGLFLVLSAIVLVEVAVLALNRLRCPLTVVAARYTEDRRDNFDIYLPSLSPDTTSRSSARCTLRVCCLASSVRCELAGQLRNAFSSFSMQRPRSVTILSWIFIAAGATGLAYHATVIEPGDRPGDVVLMLLVRALAITGGAFALRGANWARWLLAAWMTYHVVISVWDSAFAVAAHAMLLVVSMLVYFRAPASEWFRGRR